MILRAIFKEEEAREVELRRAVRALDVWRELFESVEGCGEVLAAGIITSIGDIRRFATMPKLKAFCGVHVLSDGRFARKRAGTVANWNPTARQALYLLADQWVKRPNSERGIKYREYKAKFRAKHSEVIVVDGKKRYTDGHIHKMAIWRTITKFVEHVFKKWKGIEARREEVKAA